MLESARRQGASIFIYLIFCLLIAIFVINFGPQGGQGGGCDSSSNIVVAVDGEEATQSSYHVAYANGYNRGTGKQKTHIALETLIRRELLAQEADSRGLRVTDDLIDEQIKKGRFFLGGQTAQIPGAIEEIDGERFYNHKAVRSWVGSLNVSLNSYREEQKRGLLATLMAQLLRDSVSVSREEALAHYLFENNTVQYDVVAFRPEAYRAAMKLTDADVERFLTTHAAEVEARYKADERTYKGLKPQLQLRQIFIAKREDEKPATPPAPDAAGSAAGSAAGTGSAAPAPAAPKPDATKDAAPKVGMSIDDAKAKLEAVRAAVAAGKQKFVDAAKQLNTDEAMKNSGGELGWRTAESAMLGDKAVTDAVKTLEPGEMTPVIATDRGVYLVLAEAKREGDLSFDQVKQELARELALDVWSKEAAKRAALAALDKARSGNAMNLEQMYEKAAPQGPGIDIQQIINDPNLTNEQKQQLIEMMLQQSGQKSGSLVIESRDIPAGWYAQPGGTGGGSAPAPAAPMTTKAPAPAAGSATPAAGKTPAPATTPAPAKAPAKTPAPAKAPAKTPAPATGSAAPAAGSPAPATGSAAPAAGSPATGSAAPATGAPATPPAPATPAPDVTASTDTLPAFDAVKPPTVSRFGPAPRSTPMSGLGTSKEAAAALFDELSPGMLAKKVYEADNAFIVVQLISKNTPKVEEFEKEASRLIAEMRDSRGAAFLEEWLQDRCEKLAKDGKIKPNAQLVQEFDDAGKPLPVSYRPCMSFQ